MKGGVTQGNFSMRKLVDSDFIKSLLAKSNRVVLSSEKLFSALADGKINLDKLALHFDQIQILLLIRNPYDYLRSYYVQRVKVGDFNGSLETILMNMGMVASIWIGSQMSSNFARVVVTT